jgi:hypothetical protein
LKRFGQFATRLGEQQLLFFHMFDGFGDLRLSDGTGSRRFGEIAAKSLKLRTVHNRGTAQLIGECFSAVRALDGGGHLRPDLPPHTSRPPETHQHCADDEAA